GEQAGLAGAVASDHAHPVARVQGQVDVRQQQALAAAQREVAQGNHRTEDLERKGMCRWPGILRRPFYVNEYLTSQRASIQSWTANSAVHPFHAARSTPPWP